MFSYENHWVSKELATNPIQKLSENITTFLYNFPEFFLFGRISKYGKLKKVICLMWGIYCWNIGTVTLTDPVLLLLKGHHFSQISSVYIRMNTTIKMNEIQLAGAKGAKLTVIINEKPLHRISLSKFYTFSSVITRMS